MAEGAAAEAAREGTLVAPALALRVSVPTVTDRLQRFPLRLGLPHFPSRRFVPATVRLIAIVAVAGPESANRNAVPLARRRRLAAPVRAVALRPMRKRRLDSPKLSTRTPVGAVEPGGPPAVVPAPCAEPVAPPPAAPPPPPPP